MARKTSPIRGAEPSPELLASKTPTAPAAWLLLVVVWVELAVLVLAPGSFISARAQETGEFLRADRPRDWSFPRDHGSHPQFQTEWWYFTGALQDDEAREYGYELTFFRFALATERPVDASPWRARDLILGHFTITDVQGRSFHLAEDVQRGAAGLAGADTESLRVWLGEWEVVQNGDGFRLHAGGGKKYEDRRANLWLVPERGPVLHGENGLSWKSADRSRASYYYSIPRLRTEGTMSLAGREFAVTGTTWMDHEFFTGDTPVQGLGWDWFSCRLEDGRDLMLYLLRYPDGSLHRSGTVVEADGSSRALDTEAMQLEPGRVWGSPFTGAVYPVEWRIMLPAESLELLVAARLDEQEVHAEKTVGFAYWEGLCAYSGNWGGQAIQGEGYVELTGYAPSTP